MKRYGNLYEKIIDEDNLMLAHSNARKGKVWYRDVRRVDMDVADYIGRLHIMLAEGSYKTSGYTVFERVCRGKKRLIYKLPYYPDRIVHHAIMQVLGGIWTKTLIADTYACVKGRGIHKAVKKLKKVLREGEGLYCLKLDICKFYPSVDHKILKQIIRRKIKCKRTLDLLDEIIDSADKGIPIGNYVSQHLANLYLSGFDHWIKEVIRMQHYFRYSDDIVVLHPDKAFLHQLRKQIASYLQTYLRLDVKANWQVFPVDKRGIDFLGYRFFPGYTLVRKSIVKSFAKAVNMLKTGRMTGIRALSSIMSYYGWMMPANTLNLLKKYIDEDLQELMNTICNCEGIVNPLRRRMR